MLKKLNGVIYAYIFIIVFVLVIFYQTLYLYYFTSKIIPFILCALVFILTIIGIIMEVLKINQKPRVTEEKGNAVPESKTQRGMLECTIPVFIMALLIYGLGFLIAIPLFILVYIRYNGGRWLEAISTAILTTGAVYVVFNLVLKTDLYPGKLFLYFY